MSLKLNNAEIIALDKVIKDAAAASARKGLTAGEHAVNFNCNIAGSLTVGEDEEYTPTACIPIKATLALFIRYCGITREAAKTALVQAMTEALNNDLRGSDTVATIEKSISDEDAIIAACETQVTKMIGELPKKPRKGKVTTKLTVTAI